MILIKDVSSTKSKRGPTTYNRVFAAAGLRPFAQMAFVTAAARAPAAPTGPGGPDGHLANTTNVMQHNSRIPMKRIFFIISLIVFSTSCEESVEGPVSENTSRKALVPYKLHNYWVYEFDGYEYLGEYYDGQIVLSVDSVFTYTHEDNEIELYQLLYDPRIDPAAGPNIGLLRWVEFYYEGALNRTLYWRIEPDNPQICFLYPVPTGAQWVNEYTSINNDTDFDKYTLNSKVARISVPAGTFHCYDYQIDRTFTNNTGYTFKYLENYYYTPGIGLIAIKRTNVDPDHPDKIIETWKWRLISYSLN